MAFSGINFTTFIADVKSAGASEGFTYNTPDKWFNFELGIFPESLKGNSFTIKIDSLATHDEVEDWSIIDAEIEFVLNGKHDNYLSKLPSCIDAVRQMVSNVTDNAEQIRLQNLEDQKEFKVQYLADLVAVTFGVSWIIDNRTNDEIA